ncbi:VWA domain-containing protein, partial [Aliarcobacter butzleri]|uniref:VWA domain-containing protein n=1 Tax=Aliarcobacter butzleri TaxID=28197 RepID=UPI003B2143C9
VTEDATGAYGSEITGKVAVDFGADGEDSITVKINDGTEVPGAKDTDGNYTFTMDDGKTVVLNGATGEFTYNGVPTSGTEAYYTFEFTVTDSDGDTATATTTATVAAKLPLIKIYGNDVSEEQSGTSTGNKVVGTITAEITNGVIPSKDIVIDLGNGKIITIPAGSTTGIASTEVDTTRVDDYYDQGETTENFVGTIISGNALFVDGTTISTATVTINDDKDPTGVTLNATIIKTSTINTDNIKNNPSFTVTAKDGYDGEADVSVYKTTSVDGFGVLSRGENATGSDGQVYTGNPNELGVHKDDSTKSEKIIVEFNNEIKSMDVAFSWRATAESARVDFYDGEKHIGYAIVSDGGNTNAKVTYYRPDNTILKTEYTPGGSDQIDSAYTFEPGDGTVFDRAEFTAHGADSDYLIHSIDYKEVVQGNSLDKGEKAEVLLEVQTEYKPDPKTFDPANPPIAKVDVNGTIHDVKLDENGYGTLELTTDGNTDLVAKVTEIIGGNYEAVDVSGAETGVYVGDITTKGNEDNTITAGPDGNATAGNDIIIGDKGGVQSQFTAGKNYNIALIVDTSGSMKDNSGSTKTVIEKQWVSTGWFGQGYYKEVEVQKPMTRMELTIDALKKLATDISGHDGTVNVTLIPFSNKTGTVYTLYDLNATNLNQLISKIGDLSANGGTNYEDAFHNAINSINSLKTYNTTNQSGKEFETITYFLTDGDPTYSGIGNNNTSNGKGNTTQYVEMKNAVDKFVSLSQTGKVHAIGIGNGVNENYLKFFDNTDITGNGSVKIGNQTVTGTIGKVDIVNTAEQLSAALQGGSTTYDPADLGNDTIDGGAGNDIIFGDTINTDHLAWEGRTLPAGSGTEALKEMIKVQNPGISDENLAQKMYDYIKENHASLGGAGEKDGNDTITGGAGRDIIYAQGGDDTIITDINTNNDEADGDILIDGGTGFDTIKLEGNNDIDFSKLGDIIKNIEAIDLTEGDHKLTNISLEDVLKMSGDDNKIKITGDEFDSVTFKKNDGWELKTENIGKVEGDKTFDVYTNSGNSTVQVKVEQPISDGITN